MAVGIKDIATRLGLSANTVSNILNRGLAEKYSPETRSRVVKASQKLGYRPDRAAQNMRAGKSRMVGFAAVNASAGGRLDNYGILPFMVGLSHGLTEGGFHLTMVELSEMGADGGLDLPRILEERFFDAFVVHYGAPERLGEWARRSKTPVLWWDCRPGAKEASLYRDEAEVTRILMERLFELGHRRIALLVGEEGWGRYQRGEAVHYSFAERLQTYTAFLESRGLPVLPLAGYGIQELQRGLAESEATAVVSMGAVSESFFLAASRAGLSIPEDLSLASLDLEARIPARGFRLGGVPYDRFAAGQLAARLVLERLDAPGKPIPSHPIPGVCVDGDSIRAPRGRGAK
ncbi:MAG: LacI family DNA-binding transcriptional regulator [Spirochaetes bacterium]|nr:LacI family DNA-binding transcriptional regulator [Spirochaetota bacterium]